MKLQTFFLLLAVLFSASRRSAAEDPERIGLWDGRASLGDGKVQDAEVWITVYRPAKPNGTAVVICPGGGYGGHAI